MASSSSAVYKKIEKIEKMLSNLKLVLEKKDALVKSKKSKKSESVKSKKSESISKSKSKPESISKCKSKSDLEKFTIKELKVWIKENKIDTKKLSEKHKADFIKLVWDTIMNSRIVESECDSSDSSSSDSDSSDSDSDSSSGSETDSD